MNPERYIPEQTTGSQHNVVRRRNFSNDRIASKMYHQACRLLLNISNWNSLTEGLGGDFSYVNSKAELVNSLAEEGGYIRVKLPGPKNPSGNGFDWVIIRQLEKITMGKNLSTVLITEPCPLPYNPEEVISHFYASGSSNTFVLSLKGNNVEFGIYGRNEKPNISQPPFKDIIRNTLVAIMGMIGLGKIQWEVLAEGLLNQLSDLSPNNFDK
ncbi:hypothetical protein EV198_0834 [Roseivirga ehrenbergii]|uniref:Uncharacterized protein n=1 Tax=Roseivirga ehrenbergii (strain DSM 102268 / JCM 13514 / KCTC 12282 / NCIMB 14502 / KMM 6017) TaxID=279360 RepID=A0A150X7I1_ROSEK|nr:hypothetical protein [Roseivirga ehrenbergii]KYG74678.1 hypothetical protein MB14_05590 [Roseivirga ehrenbergii]TCL13999.1 hypothetical protein EV198_0834 [Roseivirga ehrenbergii]